MEVDSFIKDFQRWINKGVSLRGSCVRGTWMEGSFTGDPEGYVKEGSGEGHLSPQGPRWGTRKGARVPGTLKDE